MNEAWSKMALPVLICFLVFRSSMGQETNPTTDSSQSIQTSQAPITDSINNSATDGISPKNDSTEIPPPDKLLDHANNPEVIFNTEEDLYKILGRTPNSPTKHFTIIPPMKSIRVECEQKYPEKLIKGMEKFELESPSDCQKTVNAFKPQLLKLCPESHCLFKIFQERDSKTVIMTGEKNNGEPIEMADWIDEHKEDLGVAKHLTKTPPEQPNAVVFWPLLISGLVLAAGLIGAYVWRNRSQGNGKDMKLAEGSCMADEENQGNTLVSVAPLNPPEPQEKPSQNGESPEVVKDQNPPAATNGHSGTKTSDTEL